MNERPGPKGHQVFVKELLRIKANRIVEQTGIDWQKAFEQAAQEIREGR